MFQKQTKLEMHKPNVQRQTIITSRYGDYFFVLKLRTSRVKLQAFLFLFNKKMMTLARRQIQSRASESWQKLLLFSLA
jgi:type II secretory pathway component PulK